MVLQAPMGQSLVAMLQDTWLEALVTANWIKTSMGGKVVWTVKNPPANEEMQEMPVWSLGWEDPLK